ncbi:DEAD/DEAH box helicase [Microcoleus sp. FACHB-53]|nr:DEAD/DEAH box helicase [Microcoleus sp. FACHB-53]
MKPTFKLKDLVQQGEAAIAAISPVLGQGLAHIDCSEVETLTPEQFTALFSGIPETWDFVELAEKEVFLVETLTESFAEQLSQWVNQHQGRQPTSPPAPPAPPAPPVPPAPPARSSPVPLHPIKALDRLIGEYKHYLLTEFRAKDPQLKAALEEALDQPLFLAQEPFYQAHRPFKTGQRWRDLPIDSQLARVMEDRSRSEFAYLHQSEAIAHLLGEIASPLVVTTGTGSGKTESFLLPVIQNAIEDAIQFKQSGLTAILVYPMNALANDQLQRIESYLESSGWAGAVSVAQYDRGTKQKERQALRQNPPHILLTNYMMLEYLLVRPADREDIFANHRCRFLVLDEVHTYRGTLGSNIALLMRRVRTHLANARQDWLSNVTPDKQARRYPELIPIGTSATIKSIAEGEYSREERIQLRDKAVQEFFSKISGAPESTIRVLGEELEDIQIPTEAAYPSEPVSQTNIDVANPEAVRQTLGALGGQPADTPFETAARHARLLWDLNRWLTRSPLSISQIVEKVKSEVKERTSLSDTQLQDEVKTALLVGAALPEGTPGALQLRAHRLIRGGWQFHRCVNPDCGKLYPMGEERCQCGYKTAPLYLCRNCGADYLRFVGDATSAPLQPSGVPGDEPEWMLYNPSRFETNIDDEDIDETETDTPNRRRQGSQKQPKQMKKRPILHGSFDISTLSFSTIPTDYPWRVTLAPARNRCLCCGGTAGSRNVVTPVALGTSAAVKVLSEGLVEALAEANQAQPEYDGKERLLVFSDSRQDAAHQARFIVFASRYDRMRRRVVQLLNERGVLSLQRIVELLGENAVRERDNKYAPDDTNTWLTDEAQARIRAWEEAPLLDEIAVNAGYRATLMNLGLVQIQYHRLGEYVQTQGATIARQLGVSSEELDYICRCLLDEIRTRGCLNRELLCYHPAYPSSPSYTRAAEWERRIKQPQGYALSNGRPIAYLDRANVPYGIKLHNPWRKPKAGGRGPSLERILKHLLSRWGGTEPTEEHLVEVLEWLLKGSFLVAAQLYGRREKTSLLQVNAEVVRLKLAAPQERYRCEVCSTPLLGGREKFPCPECHGNLKHWVESDVMDNRNVQRILSPEFIPLVAGEHTAQIPHDVRVDLENKFKAKASESKVNLLACSPTLEMGIDVGGLDAVVLRNIPPRPDNYAQRGGRAGRRTRIGLVVGYARSTPHDQYFYDKPEEMIAGEVPAPALALGNRDVIFRHLNAIAFGAAEPGLAGKMVEYVSSQGEIQQEAVDALIAGVRAQSERALVMAREAWEGTVLPDAQLDETALRSHLESLPARIQDVINRTARQVKELRKALDIYYQDLQGERAGTRAGQLIARILGIQTDKQRARTEADDRSSGYPLRRFAEFGILPGYEFPTLPAALRLLGDEREEEPISIARRLGIGQFQPDAQVFARTKRWKVIGLDNASLWNPRSESATWLYRNCQTCQLRFDASEPSCPRCGNEQPGQALPAGEFAGFLARRDESPILDEEERYATRNLVKTHPQWNGQVVGRWTVATAWGLRLSRDEEVRWINEGLPPTEKDNKDTDIRPLHNEAKGYLLCSDCGRILENPDLLQSATQGRRKARKSNQDDPFGHAENCPQIGQSPKPLALVTAGKAEVLRLMLPVPNSIEKQELQSWGLSLGYALKAGMQHLYMLDNSEIDFEFEGPWAGRTDGKRYSWISLTFIDPSLGGSGYLRRIATEFDTVAKHAIAHLAHPGCETACYRCLKSYQNQRYHELLNWPQVIPALKELSKTPPISRREQLGDMDDPRPWLEAYETGVGSPLELKFLRLFEQHGFHPQKQVPVPLDNPISVADFAMPEQHLAIYVDGAAFHKGGNRRRDRALRDRLRNGNPPWRIVELQAADLVQGSALVEHLKRVATKK